MTRTLADGKKEQILQAIIEARSIQKAAENLGVNRSTLYRNLRRYGIALKVNQILAELRKQESLQL